MTAPRNEFIFEKTESSERAEEKRRERREQTREKRKPSRSGVALLRKQNRILKESYQK